MTLRFIAVLIALPVCGAMSACDPVAERPIDASDAADDPGTEDDAGDASEAAEDATGEASEAAEDAAGDTGGEADDGDDAEVTDVPPEPTFEDDFEADDSLWDLQLNSPGVIRFAVPSADADDARSVTITLAGDVALTHADYVAPESANQISTRERLAFGTYRARFRAAACASPALEEVVTGVFVYSNDGLDLNGNDLIDNNEIDIEITCSAPSVLWLTIWTDYTDDTSFRKVTRRIDAATGRVLQTRAGGEGSWDVDDDLGTPIPELPLPGFDATASFHEMGFEWQPDRVRFFLVSGGDEIELWSWEQGALIPQVPANFMFNAWHADPQWDDDGGEADYPASDSVLEADWIRYWAP